MTADTAWTAAWLLGWAVAAVSLAFQALASVLALLRLGQRLPPAPAPRTLSIVRPYHGLARLDAEAVASAIALTGRWVEVIFCVADPADPVIPLLAEAVSAAPGPVSILTGDDPISANPKLNNLAKGYRAARGDLVAFVDAGAILPPDFPARLGAAMTEEVGLVSAVAVGSAPQGLWARVECAVLGGQFARTLMAADQAGAGRALGFVLCFRRTDLEHIGFARLGEEVAEDNAAVRLVKEAGLGVRLIGTLPERSGRRRFVEVWARLVRWAWIRHKDYPLGSLLEPLSGPLPALVAIAAIHGLWAAGLTLLAVYAIEAAVCRAWGWRFDPVAALLRDALMPAAFLAARITRRMTWQGRVISGAVSGGGTSAGPGRSH